jgi:hypothetical protein
MSAETIDVRDLQNPEGDQDPRIARKQEHEEDLSEIFNREGFLNPLIISEDDYFIVDGNYRAQVLESLGEQDEQFYSLEVIGKRDGYLFALPSREIEIDPERASMELNLYRENNSQADCARFLKYLVETRIIESSENGVNVDASPSELLTHLEHHRQRGDSWKHSEEVKKLLDRFMQDLNFSSAGSARTYINYLTNSPEVVREAWGKEEIERSHVEQLNEIAKHVSDDELQECVDDTADEMHSVRDLKSIKKDLQETEDEPEGETEDDSDEISEDALR